MKYAIIDYLRRDAGRRRALADFKGFMAINISYTFTVNYKYTK